MKAKTVTIKPGSVLLYSEYSYWKKLWSKITNKPLPFNKYILVTDITEFILIDNKNMDVCTPARTYNKQEVLKLKALVCSQSINKWDDLYSIINIIRPNTLEPTEDAAAIIGCKFYKRININVEELDEYIY